MSDRNDKLSKRFEEGLKEYGLTVEEVREDWWACGWYHHRKCSKVDDENITGLGIFHSFFPKKEYEVPEDAMKCICGIDIIRNYYITDGNDVLVIGSECIRHFVRRHGKKLCSTCKEPHKNRKDNLCNDCREIERDCKNYQLDQREICKTCYKPINKHGTRFIQCFDCHALRLK